MFSVLNHFKSFAEEHSAGNSRRQGSAVRPCKQLPVVAMSLLKAGHTGGRVVDAEAKPSMLIRKGLSSHSIPDSLIRIFVVPSSLFSFSAFICL